MSARTNSPQTDPDESPKGRRKRYLELPPEVFAALDRDAARCLRSPDKQVEAILAVYYGLDEEIEKAEIDRALAWIERLEGE